MKYKYIYFDTNGPIFYLNELDELKKYYNKIYDNINENDFYNNMNIDGYYIIQIMDSNIIYFFIELNKLDNVYKDLENEYDIIEILKQKIK